MALASFSPSAAVRMTVTEVSSRLTLPADGSPTVALVANLGDSVVFVALGDDSVTASPDSSLAVLPRSQVALTIDSNTDVAAVTLSGISGMNVAVGT